MAKRGHKTRTKRQKTTTVRQSRRQKSQPGGFWRLLGRYAVIIVGCAMYALAINIFFLPAGLMTGGVTGISIVLFRLFGLPVGISIIVINIPLFILGHLKLQKGFLFSTVFATVLLSVLIDVLGAIDFASVVGTASNDLLLSGILGGVISGGGLGLVFSTGATTGGSDILSLLINKKASGLSIGRLILVIDLVIIAAGTAVLRDITAALYTVVALYASSTAVDSILFGIDYATVAYVITGRCGLVSGALMNDLGRGVTILDGRGAYTGEQRDVLLCAIKRKQIGRLKQVVLTADPDAFVIVSEAREVLGRGFKSAGQ